MKKHLHTKYNWFKCRFAKLVYSGGEIIQCRWCSKKYKIEGVPFIGDIAFKLTPLKISNKEQ